MMKKMLVVACLVVAVSCLAGCATTTETPETRDMRITQISDLQLRMMVEDWDYFWLVDENAKTTQWHPEVGL